MILIHQINIEEKRVLTTVYFDNFEQIVTSFNL